MMNTNKESLKAIMDRRLSFLDEVPSCRAAVQRRIAEKEEPAVKKVSLGLALALVLTLLSVTALAAELLFSSKVSAARIADRELEKQYGVTAEMQTFFEREEKELPDGAVQVTYTGVGGMEYVLGSYTVLIKEGKAKIQWSHDGDDTSGGYGAVAWGREQLRQMMADSLDQKKKDAFISKAAAISEQHGVFEDHSSSAADDTYFQDREAQKTAALNARRLPEAEMILIGGSSILINYGFRQSTYDIDAMIDASSAIKDALNLVRDRFDLPEGWVNEDFRKTSSFSEKIPQYSVYYKTFSNVLQVRYMTSKYLIAMKLKSGRPYKYDLSDIVGILFEHEKNGQPIALEDIRQASIDLYGAYESLPEHSRIFIENVIAEKDYAKRYEITRQDEKEVRASLIEFQDKYPKTLTTDNVNEIISQLRKKKT